MRREEYAARLHREMENIRVSPELRQRTLSALRGQAIPAKKEAGNPMKKKFAVVLIFAIVTLMLSGVALAAAGYWGVLDFVSGSDTWLPEDAQTYFTDEVLITETDAGVLTIREVYYDGYRAHITADLTPKKANTLLVPARYDIHDGVGNLFRYTLAEAEADRRTIAQFYEDSGYNDLWLADISAAQYAESLTDSILNEDGTLTFYLQLTCEERQPTREAELTFSLFHLDSPDQYDYARYVSERTKITLPLTLTVPDGTSSHIYVSDVPQEYPQVGVRVDRITVEVMPLDIYASIDFTVIDQAAYEKLDGGLWFEFIDPVSLEESYSRQRLKTGLSSDGSIGGDPDGTVFVQHETLSANELHDIYTLRAYDAWTKERYETCTFTMREIAQDELNGN